MLSGLWMQLPFILSRSNPAGRDYRLHFRSDIAAGWVHDFDDGGTDNDNNHHDNHDARPRLQWRFPDCAENDRDQHRRNGRYVRRIYVGRKHMDRRGDSRDRRA